MPSTPNLIIQAIITATLTLGIFYVKKRKIVPHGYVTLAAVVLNALSVIIVMLPSALRIVSGASMNAFTMVVIAYSILGAAAIVVGVYLMAVWRLRKPGEFLLQAEELHEAPRHRMDPLGGPRGIRLLHAPVNPHRKMAG